MDVEIIADYAFTKSAGPLWHEDEQALYWLDIPMAVSSDMCRKLENSAERSKPIGDIV